MNASAAPHFVPADAPAPVPAFDGGLGGAGWVAGLGVRESLLVGIGSDLDSVALIQRQQAVWEARSVVWLAAAAAKADRLAGLPGGSVVHARRSLVAEVATTLVVSEGVAARRVDDAQFLVEFLPATLAALAGGEIGYRYAEVMVRQAVSLPEDARAGFEVVALAGVAGLTPSQFGSWAQRLRERLHPESIDLRHRAAVAERAVWVEPERDGMATLMCHLPAVSAFAIDDTLDQHARSLAGAEEPRTHAQLRADTLADLLLDPHSRDARVKGVRANVTITVPALTLLGHSDEPAELIGYGPIDLDTARRLTATAPSVTRLLTDPVTGARLTVGRDRYTVPIDLRAAVLLDDETCRFPGCVRRADRCDLDHTIDWANNGHTSLDNLAALCRRHHTVKHHTDWTVTQGPDRTLHWTSPSGARHTTTPPGARHTTTSANPPNPPRPTPTPSPPTNSPPIPRPTRPLPDDPPF